jgi:platelet-activating factor acetylhydrolase IB subunit alpha
MYELGCGYPELTLCRHKSIIAYLSANNLPNAAASLRAELRLSEDVFDTSTMSKYETLLEKKWTSVVRLQKKACQQRYRS